MPRINTIEIEVKTGESGHDGPVYMTFNGHTLPLELTRGSAAAGDILVGALNPSSVAHSVALDGPGEGYWQIERMTVTYHPTGEAPYSLSFGAVTLDETNAVNIYRPRPPEAFDV
jgi:hypothetical protein